MTIAANLLSKTKGRETRRNHATFFPAFRFLISMAVSLHGGTVAMEYSICPGV